MRYTKLWQNQCNVQRNALAESMQLSHVWHTVFGSGACFAHDDLPIIDS